MGMMMYQQEIRFFWPLTEQIPLELDFTDCEKPKLSATDVGVTALSVDWTTSTIATISTVGLTLESGGTLTIKDVEMPWYRKALFKLMGFKWK